jgi:hypothetical protein
MKPPDPRLALLTEAGERIHAQLELMDKDIAREYAPSLIRLAETLDKLSKAKP